MFKKYRQADQIEMLDTPEWEEVEAKEPAVEAESFTAVESLYVEDEASAESDVRADFYHGENARAGGDYLSGIGVIEIDGGSVDLGDFPALRMAQGATNEPEHTDSAEPEETVVNEEDRLSDLIARYAELEDTDEPAVAAAGSADSQDEIPSLFRVEPRGEGESVSFDEPDEPRADFTMESELAMQREISGELFDYIDTIKLSAEEIIRDRAREYDQLNKPKNYDPYNLSFNNRYDDTEEVLNSTPEISMKPKYKLEN